MSNYTNLNIGTNVENLETSEIFDTYGRIDVVMGEDANGDVITISYPNIADDQVAGRIMTVQMPMCTDTALARRAAQRIYTSLSTYNVTGFQYTPIVATRTLADPSIEFGDSVDINGVHGGFYVRATEFGKLMLTDLSAPSDEELDHEYPYQTAQQRQTTRTNKEVKSRLTINAEAIRAEVAARTAQGEQFQSTLDIQATQIAARVTKTGGNNASFGWTLTDSAHSWYSGNKLVMYVNKDGLSVTGKVTASSGDIGGFKIGAKELTYNDLEWNSDNKNTGAYIGQSGIQLGKNFKVTNQGVVTAKSLDLKGGTIKIGGTDADPTFSVTSGGAVTAKSLTLKGGSIDLGNGVFKVTTAGAVTASNLSITGGSIKINNGVFKVDTDGKVTASSLSITGGSIKIGTKFNVNDEGKVTATDMSLSGTLTIGGTNITAETLRSGAASGYDWANTSYGGYSSYASYAVSGAASGYSAQATWNSATDANVGIAYIKATNAAFGSCGVTGSLSCMSLACGGYKFKTVWSSDLSEYVWCAYTDS